jgi:hypothetical protein
MELADEIRKLKELHDSGALTDAEFVQAKATLLSGYRPDNTLGTAARKWVNFQVVMAIVGVALFLILFFGFFRPSWNKSHADFDRRWNELRPGENSGSE